MAFVAKDSNPKGKRPFRCKQAKKGPRAPQNSRLKTGVAKKQMDKDNGEKNIALTKCYNFRKKGHFT